jgi:hypothetical protein
MHDINLELVGTEMAQRKMLACLLELSRIALEQLPSNMADQLLTSFEARLNEQRGEFLYPAPADLLADQQMAINQAFQHAFAELQVGVLGHLRGR